MTPWSGSCPRSSRRPGTTTVTALTPPAPQPATGGVEAGLSGGPRGRVSGVAPRAHVAMYKVCGFEGCYPSDSAAAVQQAILDGGSVINFSIAGGANPHSAA